MEKEEEGIEEEGVVEKEEEVKEGEKEVEVDLEPEVVSEELGWCWRYQWLQGSRRLRWGVPDFGPKYHSGLNASRS